ncbi:REP-associated tyrosine transposase [Sedimentibacter sp. MB31-C6]|uniref:REP-associated tyrosine transposase n=1 Tax=Sedimentibacter sp. MB31-C6 TaxID=3109366 RepID=UPI002DDDA20C|nr:transposase [Sedimentibacter sp. MB36-C1]WSI05396.1 transposase [Sedimentibacter sp. MB36-C1]
MPRQARTKSSTGIYHIMTRGINREQIFKGDLDKRKIIEILKNTKEEIEFSIIAYCVMDNHLHLLIKADESILEILMKKINIKYAIYYNKVKRRYGHVFQDRFRSEAVEDDKYMLGVIRYIHNNPVKARITKHILDYTWSSAKDYINKSSEIILDKYLDEVINIFADNDKFIEFHKIYDDILYIDTKEEESENIQNITNNIIEKFMEQNYIVDQSQITKDQKIELAEKLLKLNLLTYREVAELCNLSYYNVFEIRKKLKEK